VDKRRRPENTRNHPKDMCSLGFIQLVYVENVFGNEVEMGAFRLCSRFLRKKRARHQPKYKLNFLT
jgi:hypothetical protein